MGLHACMCVHWSHRQTHGSQWSGGYYRGVEHRGTRPITNRQAPHINPLCTDAFVSPSVCSLSLSLLSDSNQFSFPCHQVPMFQHVGPHIYTFCFAVIGMLSLTWPVSNATLKTNTWNQYTFLINVKKSRCQIFILGCSFRC